MARPYVRGAFRGQRVNTADGERIGMVLNFRMAEQAVGGWLVSLHAALQKEASPQTEQPKLKPSACSRKHVLQIFPI